MTNLPNYSSSVILRAGPRAMDRIRTHGLGPADIDIVPGAAGGPKGLGIAGLDLAIFGEWLARAPRVRDLIGASIGAWRFAAICRGDAREGLGDFVRAYSEQRYPKNPDRRCISEYAHAMMRELFEGREAEVLSNPLYRLHVLTVRGLGILKQESRTLTPFGFACAALANAIGRRHLRHFVARGIFYDARGRPGALDGSPFDAFRTESTALTRANLGMALLASGSIPLVLEGVRDIDGAPPGTYWDGGIIDYHPHLPYPRDPGLVLYPHFTDRIIPGWLDKAVPWRRARGAWLDNVVLVSPSREYLAKLPYAKLPDRKDFKRFESDYAGRMRYWRTAIAESARLGDEFLALAERDDIVSRIGPI